MSNTLIIKGLFDRISAYGNEKDIITIYTKINSFGIGKSPVQILCTTEEWRTILSKVFRKQITIEVRPTQSYSEFVSLVEWQENKPKGWQQLDMFSNAIAEGGQNESKL